MAKVSSYSSKFGGQNLGKLTLAGQVSSDDLADEIGEYDPASSDLTASILESGVHRNGQIGIWPVSLTLTENDDGWRIIAHNRDKDIVADVELGEGGGGGGLDKVYHDDTLSGDGTEVDPLSCLIKNADIAFDNDTVVVDTTHGSHAYTHQFVDDTVVVTEL